MYDNVTSTRNHIPGSSLELIKEAILHLTLTSLQHTSLILDKHSGQMSAHVRGLSTSGLFAEHTTERTVREFVNEILLGIFFWWMNHYLNDLPRMTEDLCGSKRKKGDPV